MPFDHEFGGEGGGDDRHKLIRMVTLAGLEALGNAGQERKLCMDCLALNTAGTALALFLVQQNAEEGTEKARLLIRGVIDVAMEELASLNAIRKASGP